MKNKNKDALVVCKRCGGNACYEQYLPDGVITWLDWGCGFTTSTLMTEKSETVVSALQSSPELYKDLMFIDDQKLVWLPSTITLPNKGMVFLDGTSKRDWRWAAAKAIPLQESDKKLSPDQTHKMDMKNVRHFEQKEFMDAVEHIGMFEVE